MTKKHYNVKKNSKKNSKKYSRYSLKKKKISKLKGGSKKSAKQIDSLCVILKKIEDDVGGYIELEAAKSLPRASKTPAYTIALKSKPPSPTL